MDFTVEDDSLGNYEKRNPINMRPLLNSYVAVSVFTDPQPTVVNCTYTVCDLEKASFLTVIGGYVN